MARKLQGLDYEGLEVLELNYHWAASLSSWLPQ